MKSYYCVKLINQNMSDDNYIVYSENEVVVRNYLEFIHRKDSKVFKLTKDQLDKMVNAGDVVASELDYDLEKDVYISYDDAEYISIESEDFADEMLRHLKYIKKKVKYFRGDEAKKLEKAVTDFVDAYGDNRYFDDVKGADKTEKMLMKLDLNKFGRKKLTLFYEK